VTHYSFDTHRRSPEGVARGLSYVGGAAHSAAQLRAATTAHPPGAPGNLPPCSAPDWRGRAIIDSRWASHVWSRRVVSRLPAGVSSYSDGQRSDRRAARARTHLKSIDLELPRDQLVVITGLSGSGKSSLAFDTNSWQPLHKHPRAVYRRPDNDSHGPFSRDARAFGSARSAHVTCA
jgi:hypothetical protein